MNKNFRWLGGDYKRRHRRNVQGNRKRARSNLIGSQGGPLQDGGKTDRSTCSREFYKKKGKVWKSAIIIFGNVTPSMTFGKAALPKW